MFRLAIAAALAIATGSPALAQDTTDRYTLEKTADGYVRMDRRTGTMSVCSGQGSQLVCRLAVDDRDALDDEIEALRDRVSDLESRVAAMEKSSGAPESRLPTDEDFQKSLTMMEQFFRRFMEVARDLDKDGPQPDRT